MLEKGCSSTRVMTAMPSWKWFRLVSRGRFLVTAMIRAATAIAIPVICTTMCTMNHLRKASYPRQQQGLRVCESDRQSLRVQKAAQGAASTLWH